MFRSGGTNSPSELLRRAINDVLGIRVKYRAATQAAPEMVTEAVTVVVVDQKKEESINEKRNKLVDEDAQVGDAVLRDLLGAAPVEDDK
jgi:hypothetical protein